MMKTSNIVTLSAAISLATLSGCGTISAWFGSDDTFNATSELPDDGAAQQVWYCYGKPDGSNWQCESEKMPSLITEIRLPDSQNKAIKP